jgi:hypothetical protein
MSRPIKKSGGWKTERISKKSYDYLKSEITNRCNAGEVPSPTFESIIEEMTTEREKKMAKRAD